MQILSDRGSGRPDVNEEKEASGAEKTDASPILKSRGRSLEITGLGVIASLILSFWSLVSDGTLPFSQYLVFVCFLLVSAAAMVWRIWKLSPGSKKAEQLEPGIYRVSFGGR
jgi:hypothetical protein